MTRTPQAPVHICILGGGFGGLYTALSLTRASGWRSPHYRITIVEPRDRFIFTPLLYEVVTGELLPWEVAPSYRKLLARRSIQHERTAVKDVNLSNRLVYLQDGSLLPYDYLVLAVGSEPQQTPIPGVRDYAQSFRTLADAQQLRERLHQLTASDRDVIRVAVVGAGPNGVEIACKLADHLQQRGVIHLIDRSRDILKAFSHGSRVAAYRALLKRNVQIHLETGITAIAPDSVTLAPQGYTHNLQTDLVLWTVGTQIPAWVQQLDCAHNERGQVLVTPSLQLPDYPEVFALGDLADVRNRQGHSLPAAAQVAFQEAPHAAQNVQRAIAGRRPTPFRYLHLGEMLTLGIGAAVVTSFGITLDGKLAHLIRRGVYIQRLPTLKHGLQVAWRWLTGRSPTSSEPSPALETAGTSPHPAVEPHQGDRSSPDRSTKPHVTLPPK